MPTECYVCEKVKKKKRCKPQCNFRAMFGCDSTKLWQYMCLSTVYPIDGLVSEVGKFSPEERVAKVENFLVEARYFLDKPIYAPAKQDVVKTLATHHEVLPSLQEVATGKNLEIKVEILNMIPESKDMNDFLTEKQRLDFIQLLSSLEKRNWNPSPSYLEKPWSLSLAGSIYEALSDQFIEADFDGAELQNTTFTIKGEEMMVNGLAIFLGKFQGQFLLRIALVANGHTIKLDDCVGEFWPDTNNEVVGLEGIPQVFQDSLSSGNKVDFGAKLSREFLITYLDEDLMVVRDCWGLPELFRS